MEDVRQLVQEEGREARNLVAFHVAVDTPTRVSRKPPRAAPPPRRAPPRAVRLRSASAGRDKRSELRARYWALLFGDLQRAVGEIYNTVEAHENLNECQEVILVLENYTRDFKALGEWFRLKWEYDNTPPPQRPQSLAWEIRKTDFVRPESRRTHSVKSSPSVSGKNSPCLSGHNTPSGKNSPNLTGKASPCSGKISPRVSTCHSSTSPKANIEFFTNKVVASKITNTPEPKSTKESTRLSDIKEKDFKETDENNVNISEGLDSVIDLNSPENSIVERNRQEIVKSVAAVEIGKAEELPIESPKQEVVIKSPRHKANLDVNNRSSKVELSTQAVSTISQLDAMENELLVKQLTAAKAKNENFLNEEKQIANINNQENLDSKISQIEDKDSLSTESPTKSEENFADISNESSPKSSMDKSVNTSQNLIEKCDSIDEVADLDDEKISNDISNLTSMSITKQVSDKTTSEKQVLQSNVISENTEFITIDVTNATEENDDVTCEAINVTLENNNVKENPDEKDNQNLDNHTMLEEQNENQVDKNVYDNGIIADSGLDGCKEQLNDEEMKINHNICDNYDVKNFNEIENVAKEPKETKKFLSETKEDMKKDFDLKKNETKIAVDIKTSVKPAYSQAAAKPKPTNAIKTDVKTPTRTALVRSSTVVEMRPNTTSKTLRPFQKRNQANKCSYPFNLTTSRTSLFDTPASNNVNRLQSKRPVNRNYGMASGDAKSVSNKVDLKKRPPRPTNLKISGKGDKKEKIKPPLEKIKDYDEYSSCDTIVTQIDMSRIESTESLKTLVPEDMQMNDVANSVEVLNMDNTKNDNEGWLTVKSKRLSRESKKNSKSHWANRFHQPSATTSLPTLNMLESPKEETNVIIESPKLSKTNRAKSEQPEKVIKPEQVEKVVTEIPVSKDEVKPKDPSMIRQKSDVTGLKTKSSKNKTLTKKAEKVKDTSNDDEQSELTKNRLHSSLESLTTGLERSQESTEEPFDFDKWKAEFMSTFKYLDDDDHISNHNEILKAADPSEMSEIAEMTSQIEENEKKIGWALDIQSEVDQRKLCEEEDSLNRQIMELQQVSDIDLDTETDDTETDAEIPCEDTVNTPPASENLGSLAASLEDQYETALAGMTWAERVDTLVVLEALVARDPGRAQQLHAKLSQGIKRRGSLQDALRRLQAKQARAEKQRIEYQTERAKKIHQLLARVEEVKVAKNQLIEEKRLRMERRLQKAAENRDQYLKDIVKKAHDEDEKLREIAFIKQLQAQNRRHDFLAQCRHHTTRLRQMRRDRLSKLEEKAAREAAVGARRQALEEARRRRVESMMQRRRLRDERVQGMRELRRQERGDAAREKAEGVKSRLSALAAAAEQEVDALRSRIRDKQDASQQRLELHLQAVREKATGPRQPTTSESHEQPNNEAEEAERLEQERREREKQKNIKKKARKLRQKLLVTGNENPVYDDHSSSYEPFGVPFANKMYKVIQQISNIVMPLCAEPSEAKQNTNGIDLDEKPKKHKNKKSKAVNGDVEDLLHDEKKKSKKNKEKNGVENNNNTEMEIAEERVESKKKKKKNKDGDNEKNGKDKPKLSKASSVCSSLSDTSRSSKKCDARVYSSFDNMLLERQLNELYRMMEKFDKLYPDRQNIPEKVTIQKMQGLKVIGHMLALASEREELASQFTTKSLCTAVALVSRAAGACNALGAFLLSTNATVHIATLLHATLEKDLHSDPKEMELARHLSDCLSVALDSVLCSSRVHDDQPRLEEDIELLGTLRNRAHMIISYLCLSGCIARAEYAGEARESVQTLLTVCADLCHPCDADVGSERTSAKQSLRCALGAGLCGSRAEFCALFAGGAELGHCGSFVRAARTAHLLRALAEMDHLIVQEAFGEGGWPLEFRAAVARLLSQHAPNDKEAPRTPSFRKGLGSIRLDQTLSETMVLDLIVLVGFVIVNNPQLQETICDGWSVIKMLCTLPANWLVSPSHSHALLPTLVALAERPATAAAIAAEFSVEMLKEYMESPEAQKVKLVQVIKQGRNKKNGGKNKNSDKQ